jgi:Tfp pilus assembly protein PilZ
VYLSADETFQDAEKTTTANMSDSGCFVVSTREWDIGGRVWLKFLGNEIAVCGTVCSMQPWGNNQFLPGIGIEVDESIEAIG